MFNVMLMVVYNLAIQWWDINVQLPFDFDLLLGTHAIGSLGSLTYSQHITNTGSNAENSNKVIIKLFVLGYHIAL